MIAVYVSPEGLTLDQYNKVGERLQAAGAPEGARKHHSSFGEDGHMMVFEIWESQADYDNFAKVLLPILEEEGVKTTRPPDIMPVVNLMQSAAEGQH